MKIEELILSTRTYNCLKRAGLNTVEQLQVTPIDLLPYEHLADVPMVDAVEVPNCDECFWNETIRGWYQCEHCIGNTSGNNFLHKNKVTDHGDG